MALGLTPAQLEPIRSGRCCRGAPKPWDKRLHRLNSGLVAPQELHAAVASLQADGRLRDAKACTLAINAFAREAFWRAAAGLVGTMRAEAIEPDTITFNAAVNACAKAGRWRGALGLVGQVSFLGMAPQIITFNAAAARTRPGTRRR
uniref:Uncharacterized protein n=1 Tax=Alexandrium monilatum TaxID=311494 RepID=A0A7S4RGS5_9DINO